MAIRCRSSREIAAVMPFAVRDSLVPRPHARYPMTDSHTGIDVYLERIGFHPIVQVAYVCGLGMLVWGQMRSVPSPLWVTALVGGLLLLLPLMFGRLTIRVDAGTLTVEFGYLGWPVQRIGLQDIVRARVVSYRPIRQFGGWGIRFGTLDGEPTSVYSVRGTTGAMVELAEEKRIAGFRTRRFLIGSTRPEQLVAVLGKSSAPGSRPPG